VGLLAASSTTVRLQAAPPKPLDRTAVAAAVQHRAFRDLEPSDAPIAVGWVGIHDPLATVFNPTDLFHRHYLAVGMRYDRRRVPPRLVYLERRRLEAERCAREGKARLGAAMRREIKDEVQARLAARALPEPRLFDCVWNLDTGQLYFTGKQRLVLEAFVDLFRQTFGVVPVALVPYLAVAQLGLSAREVELVRAAEPSLLTSRLPAPELPRLPLEEARP